MSSLDERVVLRRCIGHAQFFRKPFDVPEFLRPIGTLTGGGTSRDQLRLVE